MTTTHVIAFLTRSPASRVLGSWRKRARQRRELLELSDSLLRDIGISRRDAWNEAHKPFWKP